MLRTITISTLLTFLSCSILFGQESDLYFEYLDHVEKRSSFNMLPYSEFGAYVWTGNELLDINKDTVRSIYNFIHGTGGSMVFCTQDNDTTCLISNVVSSDIILPTIVELKKNGNIFTETVVESGPSINSAVPLQDNGYIIGSFRSLYHLDQQYNFHLITDSLLNSVRVTRNSNNEIFILAFDSSTDNISISGLKDLELTPLYESTGGVMEFVVSNDSIAYILNENKIDIIDLPSGSLTNSLSLDPAYGTSNSFTTNKKLDQFYVFSSSDQSYINRYNLNGESSLLFTEPAPNYKISKIVMKDSMIHSIGNIGINGHYKTQEDILISPTNRRDLNLKNLEVLYLGLDTTTTIIPTNPPDTITTIDDLYSYKIEVENTGDFDIASYNSFSSPIKSVYFLQPILSNILCINYSDPLQVGDTQIHSHSFRTSTGIDTLSINITGVDHMPDADYSNNFLVDKTFDLVNTKSPLSSRADLSAYPNPVSDKIYFQSKEDIYCIQIYNTTGQLEYLKNSTEPITELNLSRLPSNIYFMHFSNKAKQSIAIKKIVKQ